MDRRIRLVWRRIERKTTLCALCLLIAAGVVGAQTLANVTVNGVVTDSSGAAVPDAKITAKNTATGLTHSTTTDQAGRYTISDLPAGTYDISTGASGFSTIIRQNQVLLVGQTVTLDFALQVGSVAQTVEVKANAPATIDPTESVVTRVLETQEINNLPTVSRSYLDLAALSPGVYSSGAGATPDIGGAPTYETGFVVDGGEAENDFNGGTYVSYPQDWIQEFSLVAEQAPAEFGRASAGYINAITRSGGQIHGRVYGYYQNNELNALTPPLGAAKQPVRLAGSSPRIGAMAGGPIKKDKLFYFGGYEFSHTVTDNPISIAPAFVGPASPSETIPVTTGNNVAIAKIDYQINVNNKISGEAIGENSNFTNQGVSGGTSLGAGATGFTRTYNTNDTWTKIISSNKLNDLNFTYSQQTPYSGCNYESIVGDYPNYPAQSGSTPEGDPVGWLAALKYSGAPGGAESLGCPTSYNIVGEPEFKYTDMAVTETYSLTHEPHDIKLGVQAAAERLQFFGVRELADGEFAFSGSDQLPFNPASPATYPISDTMTGDPTAGGGKKFDLWGPNFSFFAEDSWKIKPNLTLNYGLRYQFDFANHFFTNDWINPAIANGTGVGPISPISVDWSDVAPRFGFAWTPFHGKDNTVVRGGIGVFYDESHSHYAGVMAGQNLGVYDPTLVSASTPSENPWCVGNPCTTSVPTVYQQYAEEVLAYALATYTGPNFFLGNYQMPKGGPDYKIPAPTQVINGSVEPAPTAGGTIVDPSNYKVPGDIQISAGIGHQFGNVLDVQTDYVYTRGYRQVLYYDSNVSMLGEPLYPQYGAIFESDNLGVYDNNSLRVKSSYRDKRGDLMQVAYTLSYAYDNSPLGFSTSAPSFATAGGAPTISSDPYNPNYDWGAGTLDIRNNFVFSGTGMGLWGISLSPIFSIRSGLPFNATDSGVTPAGCPVYYSTCYFPGYPRDSLRLPKYISLGAHLAKTFRLGEKRSATVFMESFNVPNLRNYTAYNSSLGNKTTFNTPSTIGTMRQVQLGGRFDF